MNMKTQTIVTTSWDDGDPLDMRVMELLRLRGLPGTFYIPITGYLGRRTIRSQDMRELVHNGFEIGAHSYSHRSLDGLEEFELKREIQHCRTRLEDSISQPVTMFCYPNGRYDQRTRDFVQKSGYIGARTTRMMRTDAGDNRFEIPTTVQAFPHPALTYVKNTLKGRNGKSLVKLVPRVYASGSWVEVGMRTFDYVLKHGGVWHLYGHSWELEDFRLWDGLCILLDYVSQRDGVQYLTNGEVATRVYGSVNVASEVAA